MFDGLDSFFVDVWFGCLLIDVCVGVICLRLLLCGFWFVLVRRGVGLFDLWISLCGGIVGALRCICFLAFAR